jgi:hypothetical protein
MLLNRQKNPCGHLIESPIAFGGRYEKTSKMSLGCRTAAHVIEIHKTKLLEGRRGKESLELVCRICVMSLALRSKEHISYLLKSTRSAN